MAGLTSLFDVRIDGIISENRSLPGKPAPDVYLEAAKKLKLSPNSILVVEDAQMGVEAAKKGGFSHIIGFSEENGQDLTAYGAHEVVHSLNELRVTKRAVPNALNHSQEILDKFSGLKPAIFFDYDGTLLLKILIRLCSIRVFRMVYAPLLPEWSAVLSVDVTLEMSKGK